MTARGVEILHKPGSSIEDVAQAVCDVTRGTDRQISQFSTIGRLFEFFLSIDPNHELISCAQQWLAGLDQIQAILNTGNEDVCSGQKIELIERFHHNFISKSLKDKSAQKAHQLSALRMLKLFFMHYVSEISAVCEQSTRYDLSHLKIKLPENSMDALNAFKSIQDSLIPLEPKHGYRDMFLIWNFIDSFPLEHNDAISRYLHTGSTRLVIQMSKAKSLLEFQESFRTKLRPIYSQSLLSVMRLVEMGFYPANEGLVQLLSSSPELSLFYPLTQLCETVSLRKSSSSKIPRALTRKRLSSFHVMR